MLVSIIMSNSFSNLLSGTTAPSLHSDCDKPFVSDFLIMKQFTYKGKTVDISSDGDVTFNGKKVGQSNNGTGYMTIIIKEKRFYVHRLVCQLYNGDCPDDKSQVNHKDGVRDNNKMDNLEWCTASENARHAYEKLNRVNVKPSLGIKGVYHAQSKTVDQLDKDTGELIKTWGSILEAASSLNCDSCSIIDALKGRSKTSKGFKWRYSEISLNKFQPRNEVTYLRRKMNKK